ncbi:MAG: ABC transporter [Pseudanabaena sp. RU_4_16]|nr:ABC transporter [Pseudanabaena sp. RU_4_16]NKB17960.1 ABC transporter [Pseudanabaena sp. CRU_2_10]
MMQTEIKHDDLFAHALPTNPDDPRPTQKQIAVRIGKNYHQEPVISQLVSKYGVTVNIMAALLGESPQEDGWFNLELQGTDRQIHSALNYLNELDLEVWDKANSDEQEGW